MPFAPNHSLRGALVGLTRRTRTVIDGKMRTITYRDVTHFCLRCPGSWRQREWSHIPAIHYDVCARCAANALNWERGIMIH